MKMLRIFISMSQTALLLSTKAQLLENLTFNETKLCEAQLDIMPDGRPPAIAGEFFCAVHPGSMRNSSYEVLDIIMGLNITLTYRIARIPEDRIGIEIVAKLGFGIEQLADDIINIIHNNQTLINNANEMLRDHRNRFVEPLRFSVANIPRLTGANWVKGLQGNEVALIKTISFDNARRVEWADFMSYTQQVLDLEQPSGLNVGIVAEECSN